MSPRVTLCRAVPRRALTKAAPPILAALMAPASYSPPTLRAPPLSPSPRYSTQPRVARQVAEFFNEPLLRYYASLRVDVDPAVYGTDPIFYLVAE